jgi:predicted nucleotidyltransferase component of viral defense system
MTDADNSDSDVVDFVDVDVHSWVDAAAANPVLHRDRQVAVIVLTTIGMSTNLRETLILKGGTLMALAFKSVRTTADIDFTAEADPEDFAERLTQELNDRLGPTALRLGYPDYICKVQSVKKMPKARDFADHDFPALRVRIASALRGTNEEKRIASGQALRTLDIDISFKDQVYAFQELHLTEAGVAVRAFTVHELIAEKLRALLQQPIRNRYRRQDVYDLAFLFETVILDANDRHMIHATLLEKCCTRNIFPTAASIDDPEVRERAERDWQTFELELEDVPSFDSRYSIVCENYHSLPWDSQ